MARKGNEGSHRLDGLTVTGGLEAGSYSVGPNGTLATRVPDVFSSICVPPGLLAPTTAVANAANQARGSRAIVPRDGRILEMAIYISTTSGNLDVGIYDCAATTRNRLYAAGATAAGAGTAWQTFTPSLDVYQGQAIELVVAADNGTVTFSSVSSISSANMSILPSAAWLPTLTDQAGLVAGSTNARLAWTYAAAYPLPTTLAESSMATTTAFPLVLCRLG
jgi:hypothetical protein